MRVIDACAGGGKKKKTLHIAALMQNKRSHHINGYNSMEIRMN